MSTQNEISKFYKEHLKWLEKKAKAGNERAVRSLAMISLIESGWRFGDQDPGVE